MLVAAIGAARSLAIPNLEANLAPLVASTDPEVRRAARNETSDPTDAADRVVAGSNPVDSTSECAPETDISLQEGRPNSQSRSPPGPLYHYCVE